MHAVCVVVPSADLPILCDFALDREVGLLRVTKLEILLHRYCKWQRRQRIPGAEWRPYSRSSRKCQVALTGEERIGLEEIESLLLRQIAHRCCNCGRTACDVPRQRALKDIRGIESREIQDVVEGAAGCCANTGAGAAGFNQRGFRAIKGIGEESKREGRIVIKDSVARADYRLAIAPGVPGKADTRLHVLAVERDPLKDALRLGRCCIECSGR